MSGVICLIIMAILFLLISILLFQGKCSWLISGYNTMSKEEKEKFDKKKLCQSTGVICLVVGLMMLVMAYLGYRVEKGFMSEEGMLPFGIIFVIVIFTIVGINIWYLNSMHVKK